MLARNSSFRPYFFVVLASTFLQGSSFVSTKIVLTEMAPLWTASVRFFIAALSLLPFVWLLMKRGKITLHTLPWSRLAAIGMLQTTGVMALLNIGLTQTTPATAAILMASNPLLVVVLARLFLDEKTSTFAAIGLLLAFSGVVVCIGMGGHEPHGIGHGELLVILASTCWAASTVLNKKFNFALSTWIMTFWQMLFGSLLLALVAVIAHQPLTWPTTGYHWFMFAWLAIPASTGAIGLWFLALKLGGSVQTSGFLFLCPLFAAIITFFLNGQVPQWHEVGGGVLIGLGLYTMSRR